MAGDRSPGSTKEPRDGTLSLAFPPGLASQAPFPMALLPMRRPQPSTRTTWLYTHTAANATSTSPYFPFGSHVLDLSSDEETVGFSHSFCSDFQGMHLWGSSSIQAHAQTPDMQSCRFHQGTASELNHVSIQKRPDLSHGAGNAASSQVIEAHVPQEKDRR